MLIATDDHRPFMAHSSESFLYVKRVIAQAQATARQPELAWLTGHNEIGVRQRRWGILLIGGNRQRVERQARVLGIVKPSGRKVRWRFALDDCIM